MEDTVYIQEAIMAGVPFYEIAEEFGLSVTEVRDMAITMYENEQFGSSSHDHLERDHDEPYEPEESVPDPDSWYESQYDLGDDYYG